MSSPPPPSIWPGTPPAPSSTVVPFPLPWGNVGCSPCPPGGMDALMKCYCDIQAAAAFISKIMIDQINNNPDVVAAIIAAIEKSGSNLPLIGVTNGSAAQPGQVGEYVELTYNGTYPTGTSNQIVTLGILNPGDWQLTPWLATASLVNFVFFALSPPHAPGFSTSLIGYMSDAAPAGESAMVIGNSGQLLTAVPTLVAMSVEIQSTVASTFEMGLECWRMR